MCSLSPEVYNSRGYGESQVACSCSYCHPFYLKDVTEKLVKEILEA